MDYNSITNQEIKKDFINREVVACASSMMWELEQKECFQEQIMDLFYQQVLNVEEILEEIKREEYQEDRNEWLEENANDVPLEELDQEDLEMLAEHIGIDTENYKEPAEIMEYWIVTNWLGDKLEEQREIVENFLGFTIWGRQCTGQAIYLDDVISNICKQLNMLK